MTYTKAAELGLVLRVMTQSWFGLPLYWKPMMGVLSRGKPVRIRQ